MSDTSSPVDVSVIIPCHNYAHFLPDAVASVAAQTYAAWEIIIVDDGSTDATLSTAQSLMAQYPGRRIRLLKQPDRGPATARNNAARYAVGTYLLHLDADDMLAPTMLARATDVLRQHADVGFVYTGLQLFGQDWHYWPSVPFNPAVLRLENMVSPHALVRRLAWQQAGGFDTSMPHFEDWEFWMRVVAAGWRGWHIQEPLVYYRRHSRSMSVSGRSIAYEWDARARIIRRHPQLYGRRLVAWATVYCARRSLPTAQQLSLDDTEICEILPAPAAVGSSASAPSFPRAPLQRAPLARRLIRAVPFKLRFRVKCRLRAAQLALRATGFWL